MTATLTTAGLGPVVLTSPTAVPRRHYASPVPALDDMHVVDAEHFIAIRHIRCDDAYLEGHYPGFPIYPGVFLIESACVAARQVFGEALLTSVESVRFLAPLRPGDDLHLQGNVQQDDGATLTLKVLATQAAGRPVARMTLQLRRRDLQRRGGQQ